MKNQFTTIYLFLFMVDSILSVLGFLLIASGVHVLEGPPFSWLEMGFHFLILPLAIVQVIIAYRQKLKQSAKIIGLYPLILVLLTLFTVLILAVSNASQLIDKNTASFVKGMSNFSLLASIVQLCVGIWAAKDLSGGHFITEIKSAISTKKILMNCSIALVVAVVFVIAVVIIIFQNLTSGLAKVPNDLIKYYRSSEFFNKSVFIEDERIGRITDIMFGKLDPNPQLSIGMAGTKGAILLNKARDHKVFIPFSESSEDTGIVKNGDKCKFLSRRGSFEKRDVAFIDHDGKYLWKYSGRNRAADDTAVGDLNGDGKLEFVVGFNGGDGIHLLDQAGNKVWEKPDGNVWHVEIVDTDNDGHLKIVHSDSAGSITIRD